MISSEMTAHQRGMRPPVTRDTRERLAKILYHLESETCTRTEALDRIAEIFSAEIHKACEVTPEMLAKSIKSSGPHIFEMSNVQTCDNITAALRERYGKGE